MKFLDKFLNLIDMKDDDDFDDDEFEDEEEEEEVPAVKRKPVRRLTAKEEEPAEEVPPVRETKAPVRTSRRPTRENVVPMRSGKSDIVVTSVKDDMDARSVCDMILSGRAVILNIEGTNADVAQQAINFISGAVYSVNGNGGKISKYIFVFAPSSISITGDAMLQSLIENTEEASSLRLER